MPWSLLLQVFDSWGLVIGPPVFFQKLMWQPSQGKVHRRVQIGWCIHPAINIADNVPSLTCLYPIYSISKQNRKLKWKPQTHTWTMCLPGIHLYIFTCTHTSKMCPILEALCCTVCKKKFYAHPNNWEIDGLLVEEAVTINFIFSGSNLKLRQAMVTFSSISELINDRVRILA